MGQTNNVICYFGNLSSYVKQCLFNVCCTSFFGSKLWPLDRREIETLCIAWRRAVRRIWCLPNTAHNNNMLRALSNSLPLRDVIQNRVITFIRKCLNHKSHLIRGVTAHGVWFARARSPVGYNFLLVNRSTVATSRSASIETADIIIQANFIRELSCLRDGVFCFTDNSSLLSSSELSEIIAFVSTS